MTDKEVNEIHEENKSRVSLGQRRERSRGTGLVGEKEGEMQRGGDSGEGGERGAEEQG